MTVMAPGIRFIDVRFQRAAQVIAAAVLEDRGQVALLDPGPTSALGAVRADLAGRGIGIADVGAILLTHIHLDHAGATGVLVRENPAITVYVHERGAPHLIDPTKLLKSATRLYGDRMATLWGAFLPVPAANVRALAGGEAIEAGGRALEVAATPGHASHHLAYLDVASRIAFVGDVAGVSLPPTQVVLPPTPPPDVDLEAWEASLTKILAWQPDALFLTHFGLKGNPAVHVQELLERLREWAGLSERLVAADLPEEVRQARFVRDVRLDLRRTMSDAEAEHYALAVPPEQCWAGLQRYWTKKWGAK
jgi:glyoxylase-like metal-dependent hydrolase (beta-lactamase superfamily II)